MRMLLICLTLALAGSLAQAQDPGMQAAQQAQLAAQAAQQANDQAMQAGQQAAQAMQNAQAQAVPNTQCPCGAATPKFSLKPGPYSSSSSVTVKIRDGTRGAVIYYTTDGWTPTASSTRYTGPITIASTTTLQAVAISPYGRRSRVASGIYTLNGAPTTPGAGAVTSPNTAASSASVASGRLLLPRGTPVPFVFTRDVNSKTADVGDQIFLTLTEDLRAGDVVLVKKGTPAVATVTEVERPRVGGAPGEVSFQVDRLQSGSATIKLRGSAAREGQDKEGKAFALAAVPVVPVFLFVRGKEAEIKKGTSFTAFVDADTLLSPAN
jgi:hypothetical protein